MGKLNNQISITSVGHIAQDYLKSVKRFEVMGLTSRGIFLSSESRWLLFLTLEPYRSPLTINISAPEGFRDHVSTNMILHSRSRKLILPTLELPLKVKKESIYFNTSPIGNPIPNERQLNVFRRIIEFTANNAVHDEYRDILVDLIAEKRYSDSPGGSAVLSLDEIRRWQRFISSDRIADLNTMLAGKIGLGKGLTPIADDIIIGFLLRINRWRYQHLSMGGADVINEYLVSHAYNKTTSLSANLIELSSEGISDERLTKVLDAIMLGKYPPEDAIKDLLHWGDSSGIGALIGMAIAISIC